MLGLIIRDEARHVTFGINYLEEFVETLTEEEKEDRAQFAYEACWLSRERLVSWMFLSILAGMLKMQGNFN